MTALFDFSVMLATFIVTIWLAIRIAKPSTVWQKIGCYIVGIVAGLFAVEFLLGISH